MIQSQRAVFKGDINQIEGDGDSPCPRCGVTISLIAETNTVYRIIDKFRKQQHLEEIVILCTNCGSKIHLFGFLRFTQACPCIATKPVLFWICVCKMHEKPRTPRMEVVDCL